MAETGLKELAICINNADEENILSISVKVKDKFGRDGVLFEGHIRVGDHLNFHFGENGGKKIFISGN